MKHINSVAILSIAAALSACSSVNSTLAERREVVEMYHVFDIKTKADTATIAKATSDGLSANTNNIQTAMPLQLGKTIPVTPGRFSIDDVAAGMNGQNSAMLKMLANQSGGLGLKVANCEGAVWTSKAVRNITGSNNLTLYSCLYKYRDGYNLDMYAVFTKESGGLYQVIREGANAIAGTPEAWVNKTIVDAVRSIERAAGTRAVHVEGQPELGPLPAVDQLSAK
ncbi:hypothetical protein GTP56_05415 [Duganella sp. FT134W]|uniref:Lipoprotein n=1 Tax=Duganella margarita TaxID=2692170 RepID=A0A7X4KFL2_9BURK|nr:hypothetical protein [Duganella margarita]MYM71634.1 hypothetical protein [Duganella margarita]